MLSLKAYNNAPFLLDATMKYLLNFLVLVLVLLGCKNESKLTFEPQTISNEACLNCPEITIQIPKALDKTKIAETINTAIEEEIISLLLYDDELEVSTVQDALVSFKNGYLELQKLYSDETTKWEASIQGEITYEDKNLLTIVLNTYLFTGGAHGYTSKQFLNFEKSKAAEIDNSELFSNQADFRMYAESIFRKREQIPRGESINSTGFMFENDSFHLPENIGFTEKGLTLLYNPYEVASFADGTIELVLPHTEVKKYLKQKPKS